jgi:predicted dehydrogenase
MNGINVDKIKIGVVGLGAWGWNVARSFYDLPDCVLAACSDLNEVRRASAEHSWPGVVAYRTLEEMLERADLDAVVISSPAVTHYPLARKVLLAGKDVFIEKPFTLNVDHAEELLQLAEARSRVLMVGHLLEYHPVVEELRKMIAAGELGDVYYIYTQRVNLGRIRGDENALWSFAPHDISQIVYMLGADPVDVSARGQSFIQDGIEDVVFLSLYFSNRIMAHIHLSWLDPHKVRSTTIVGSKRMAVFDDVATSEKLRIYDSCATPPLPHSYGEAIKVRFGDIHIPHISSAEPLKIECQHFLDCVRSRTTPRSDAKDGLRTVRILQAAQTSLEQDGIPVRIHENAGMANVYSLDRRSDVRIDGVNSELFYASERADRRWTAMRA